MLHGLVCRCCGQILADTGEALEDTDGSAVAESSSLDGDDWKITAADLARTLEECAGADWRWGTLQGCTQGLVPVFL